MGTKNDEDREFWCEFFLLYQELPELWKVKSEVYKNRYKKDVAYDKMVEKMKEIEPKADRAMVRTKINAFRTSYRRELKKVKSSIRSGAGTDDIYEPNLWYYNELDFLRDQEGQTQGTFTMDGNEISEEMDQMNEITTVDGDSVFPRPLEQQSTSKQKLAYKRNTTENEETKRAKLLDMACMTLQSPKSDSQIIASGWGIELSKMTTNQQLYAKKCIDDILFEGRLGNLHRHSVSINNSPSSLNLHSTVYNQYPQSYNPRSSYSSLPSTHSQSPSPILQQQPHQLPYSSSSQTTTFVPVIKDSVPSSIQDLLNDQQFQ